MWAPSPRAGVGSLRLWLSQQRTLSTIEKLNTWEYWRNLETLCRYLKKLCYDIEERIYNVWDRSHVDCAQCLRPGDTNRNNAAYWILDQGGGEGASLVNPVNVRGRPPGVSDVRNGASLTSHRGLCWGGRSCAGRPGPCSWTQTGTWHCCKPGPGFKSMILQRGGLGTGLDNLKLCTFIDLKSLTSVSQAMTQQRVEYELTRYMNLQQKCKSMN